MESPTISWLKKNYAGLIVATVPVFVIFSYLNHKIPREYYFEVCPKGKATCYHLKGEIEHQVDCDEEGCSGEDYLTKAYFQNGGYVSFDDCAGSFNKSTYCVDNDGNGWSIRLKEVKIVERVNERKD